MIGELEGIVDTLEGQIGAFQMFGPDIAGDIENGFAFNPPDDEEGGNG